MVPSRQVSPADALTEQDISPDEEPLGGTVEPHAAGRMTRQKEDLQLILSQQHFLTWL